eukprot:GEMP01000022.1.p1 GENE.GEMP01000022.1~~GEMP01000022.1.p1  ORF type:complete len:4594 (-),score=1270.22 GEMP01000022.1:1053-14834(-)
MADFGGKVNIGPMVQFLNTVCPALLSCPKEEISRGLAQKAVTDRLRQFLGDSQISSLLISREIKATEENDEAATGEVSAAASAKQGEPEMEIVVDVEVSYKGNRANTIAFTKRSGFNDAYSSGTSFVNHLQIMSCGYRENEYSPFELVQSYLQNTIGPLLSTYKTNFEDSKAAANLEETADAKVATSVVQRKLAEFSMSLMQLQDNVEIPEIVLAFDPELKAIIEKWKADNNGEFPTADGSAFEAKLQDNAFVVRLQGGVSRWIKEISTITKMERDLSSGGVLQEVNFWIGMEKALLHVQQQLHAPEVELTLNLLRVAKRFIAHFSLEQNTGVKAAMEKVQSNLLLMKEFPTDDLMSAQTIDQVTQAIRNIFQHMRKHIKQASQYPPQRAFHLVETLSRDLSAQIIKILSSQRLMLMDYENFEQATGGCSELFKAWDSELPSFKDKVREMAKLRGERPAPRIHSEHHLIQERIDDLRKFRKQHMKLKDVLEKVLADAKESGALKEINASYDLFTEIETLDVSHSGVIAWEKAKKMYDDKIDRAESQITNRLRDRLGSAKTASQMFRVFSKFNALFFRPKIRGAIQEYQSVLIQTVKEDVTLLQNKFLEKYPSTQAYKIAKIRDFPEVAGSIIWGRQLSRRLEMCLSRVEDVLGRTWEQHAEGHALKQDTDQFKAKLNTVGRFEQWREEVKEIKNFDTGVNIFEIRQRGPTYELMVNFDTHVVPLFKEVRNFNAMPPFRVPYSIKVTSDEAKLNYPFAMALQEAARTYMQTCNRITPRIEKLIAGFQNEVQTQIMEMLYLKWDSDRVDGSTRSFSEIVFEFQEKVTDLLTIAEEIDRLVKTFDDIDFATKDDPKGHFLEVFEKIQKMIDDMALANYSNLTLWVNELGEVIEKKLVECVRQVIGVWQSQFEKWPKNGMTLIPNGSRHSLKIQSHNLILDPPKEKARVDWTRSLHETIGIVCNVPKLDPNRFDGFKQKSQGETYRHVLLKIPEKVLQDGYDCIERVVWDMEEYVNTWLQYQSLWDITSSQIFEHLGDKIELWQSLLEEIKVNRKQLDSNADEEKAFGPIHINYESVQSKIQLKYDQWQREIMAEFGEKVAEQMGALNKAIASNRKALEESNQDGDNTDWVLEVLKVKGKFPAMQENLDKISASHKLLERQRYIFPQDFPIFERLESDFGMLKQILDRKTRSLDRELPRLKAALIQQDRAMDEKIKLLYYNWSTEKPIAGEIGPSEAMEVIQSFAKRMDNFRSDFDSLTEIKKTLDIQTDLRMDALTPLTEELDNLRAVWSELSSVASGLETLKETPWTAVVAKKIRGGLEEILNRLKALPPKFKQYEAYEGLHDQLKKYVKLNMLIQDLKTEALKERHWKQILTKLGITRVGYIDLTLGNLWDHDLADHESEIRDVLTSAQGEMALEEFLRQVREYWTDYELEMVLYKTKCRIIKSWDEIFNQIDEHLTSLGSMKLSPYFKAFEEEATTWDERLNKLRILFDCWIDVQRRWVYLEGIFYGSSDIQTLLPQEHQRFKNIDSEYVGLLKKTAQKPKILEVAGFDGVQRKLERLSDLLTQIQKALGDYLEKQRSQMPRFYFVGDDDLLEMIGNSREIKTVSRHLSKMFAGITALENADSIITGMMSREDEVVKFPTHIKLVDDPSINAWLSKVEKYMALSLAGELKDAVESMAKVLSDEGLVGTADDFKQWVDSYACQVLLLAITSDWSERTDASLAAGQDCTTGHSLTQVLLKIMADMVVRDISKRLRSKFEQLITEVVHQRDVDADLIQKKIKDNSNFQWLQIMRMYWNAKEENPKHKMAIRIANAIFHYGFEYLGVVDKLVQTPLTDRAYLTLTQALHMRMGGNPFGPAGTGKTETVKALGSQLGNFVLVFNCDESFDFQAMGRIFVGLCQVGAWGCFDEFNRLEERMLSAVSELILMIQTGMKAFQKEIELLGKPVKLNQQMAIFVTMNPGYAGRSNLPDNLKQLFRGLAMTKPDKKLIAQVMLFSQGFQSASRLAGKIVSLFELCGAQLSDQPHYDFGLRSLKAVLITSGNMKRESLKDDAEAGGGEDLETAEETILIRAVCNTLVPKLIAEDKPLLSSLLGGVFPGRDVLAVRFAELQREIENLCTLRNMECTTEFLEKCLQLYSIQKITHGVMMVGTVGTGKSCVWRTLMDAMEKLDGTKGESHIVDPKVLSKEELYGRLDNTTLEWTDGVFTDILRRITNSERDKARRHWIIFDGDVDPEWAENLNSVLDDNKLLTLPNGERIAIPPNVRIMFEVETLKYATLATVSRCGMVWFADDVVTTRMMLTRYLKILRFGDLELKEKMGAHGVSMETDMRQEKWAHQVATALEPYFGPVDCLVGRTLECCSEYPHIMTYTHIRVLTALFSILNKGVSNIYEYNDLHEEVPLDPGQVSAYITKYLLFAICWSFGGDMTLLSRMEFCADVAKMAREDPSAPIDVPAELDKFTTLLEYEARLEDQKWHMWKERVPAIDIDPEKLNDHELIINTVDTTRHRACLSAWMQERRPFILCGPPGSGKTMTLMSTLKASEDFELASLNFSSGTTPHLLMQTLTMYCECVKLQHGLVMRPKTPGKWLFVFCDEINLPIQDAYGTQRVLMLVRQISEHKGFYRPSDRKWVHLERVQFLGACNPPTDAGRWPMSDRFMRHTPIVFVDYPGFDSLKQIYGTFCRAIMKFCPMISDLGNTLTHAMVRFYDENQRKFSVDMQPHYLYSPRELTRWKVAIHESVLGTGDLMETENLVRLFIHEGLRIFCDRLVYEEEREWANTAIDKIAMEEFTGIGESVIARPILFSCYDVEGKNENTNYKEVDREHLRILVKSKLNAFYEEQMNVHLVIFDDVLDHIVRIDRVLRQPLGHLLLVGASGAGKTVLSRFVSWMNDISVYQIKAGRNYDVTAFENDLRTVMKRAGVKGERISFIFDESNVLGPAFLERMNALLASGEVPGLFEGDEYANLINEIKQVAQSQRSQALLEDADYFSRFTKQVQRNLHIVFTMNPANPDFYNRSASSPALFNRCVIDWFGDWNRDALTQVAVDFLQNSQLEIQAEAFEPGGGDSEQAGRDIILSRAIVAVHDRVDEANGALAKVAKKYNFVTPRDYLDFINHYISFVSEKRDEVLENKTHLEKGLLKLRETEEQVAVLGTGLKEKEKELGENNKKAEEKMQQMVVGQSEAESKKKQSEALARDLEEKSGEIETRSKNVEKELGDVEPKLQQARDAVSNISNKNLQELRALNNPPHLVKLALSAAIILLNGMEKGAPVTWDYIRREMKRPDFIPAITQFQATTITNGTRDRLMKECVSLAEWDPVKIMHSSQAAGPLALWVSAQLDYAAILISISPLRAELASMEKAATTNKDALVRNEELVKELEDKIQSYKTEYAQLITAVEVIKKEMQVVDNKCKRSIQLLSDLSTEKVRWLAASSAFDVQMATLFSDCLLSAGFCTYIGFFDHLYRTILLTEWREFLRAQQMRFQPFLSLVDFLSKPAERLRWTSNGLPDDDLCTENAVILKRFLRYPLMVDPSGQAVAFITNEFAKKKLIKTSFVADNFLKNLESSLRFGTPILVQDVDKVEPILNSVLNKETHKQGGRVLITVGDSDIDFSPAFMMFMSTRDPNCVFTPDLCSRVTFVNFTITPSSLKSQCLNLVLKYERPEVDQKRRDVLKLQGEFKVKMREMEDKLLQALSNVQGSILDDDKVIATMETLKKQAKEIEIEVQRTDEVMKEIGQTSMLYSKLATCAARLFFSMESLGDVSYLYRYSLAFFLDIYLESIRLAKNSQTYEERLDIITKNLVRNTYQKLGHGLLEADMLVFCLRLFQIVTDMEEPLGQRELDLFLKGSTADVTDGALAGEVAKAKTVLGGRLSNMEVTSIQSLYELKAFHNVLSDMEANAAAWNAFMDHPEAETCLPQGWRNDASTTTRTNTKALQAALIVKALRPDRLIIVLAKMVEAACGEGFLTLPELDLAAIVQRDSNASRPLIFVSSPGFDPSGKVLFLAETLGKQVASVAMGSPEGYPIADKGVLAASKQGTWLLLKNVHLCISWLMELEKKLYSMHPHENFRLFLTMESTPKIPANLIRQSRVFVFEPPSGIKASLNRSFTNVLTANRVDKKPAERSRLHFLLAFLHAVVIERLRFTPIGWTKKYEFSDADQLCGMDTIDGWMDAIAGDKVDNVDPAKIPWHALQTVLQQAVYGGRIDNEFDREILDSFIEHLFSEAVFGNNFIMAGEHATREFHLNGPDGRKREDFVSWVDANIPLKASTAWLGLSVNAERLIRLSRGQYTVSRWSQLQSIVDEVLSVRNMDSKTSRGSLDQAAAAVPKPAVTNWLFAMHARIVALHEALPKPMSPMVRTAEKVKDPLWRCLDREIEVGRQLLEKVRADLERLLLVTSGKEKTTNEMRALAESLKIDSLPIGWKRYAGLSDIGATEWLKDFNKRLAQLTSIQKDGKFYGKKIWFGGLFFAEAFLTATREASAQRLQKSLEDLVLSVHIDDNAPRDEIGFLLNDITVEGAMVAPDGFLTYTEQLSLSCPIVRLTWIDKASEEAILQATSDAYKTVPVYLNKQRSTLVSSFRLKVQKNINKAVWVQLATALILWSR